MDTFAGYTAKQLADALFDVLDGNRAWYEIQENTGMGDARCKEISEMVEAVARELRAFSANQLA